MQHIKKVEEFHKTFNHPVLETPTIPDENRCKLRVNLLQEELNELKSALDSKDIVEVMDALGDLEYVLCGAVLEFGLKNEFDNSFNLIHESNMSKACYTEQEAKDTIEYYKTKNVNAFFEKVNDKYVIYRLEDKKVLKSMYYNPVNLSHINSLRL